MKILMDTHVLLWWLVDSTRLSRRSREVLARPDSELYWSAASSWELAIKAGLGRLSLPERPRTLIPKVIREQALFPLDITHAHVLAVADLPRHHRDPFDRLLVAQCRQEKLRLLSSDVGFDPYGVDRIW